jgi:pimeloyl-ACP methyl ester carboxylesterase
LTGRHEIWTTAARHGSHALRFRGSPPGRRDRCGSPGFCAADTVESAAVDGINGLRIHVLEAGFADKPQRCVVLFRGFPELAYSWRNVMLPHAGAGFHVVAPDLRGYGRTTRWDDDDDGDLGSCGLINYVRDAVGLVSALGHRSVAAVVGHDFGSPVAAWCGRMCCDQSCR